MHQKSIQQQRKARQKNIKRVALMYYVSIPYFCCDTGEWHFYALNYRVTDHDQTALYSKMEILSVTREYILHKGVA